MDRGWPRGRCRLVTVSLGRQLVASAGSAAVLLVLLSCSGPSQGSSGSSARGATAMSVGTGDRIYSIATLKPGEPVNLAGLGGILSGRANGDGTACFWLGEDASRTAVMWPLGYTAKGTPLAVYDPLRKRIATIGQSVELSGGLIGPPDRALSLLGCSGIKFHAAGLFIRAHPSSA